VDDNKFLLDKNSSLQCLFIEMEVVVGMAFSLSAFDMEFCLLYEFPIVDFIKLFNAISDCSEEDKEFLDTVLEVH